MIVLNKCDLVSNVAVLERTESAIQHLNPTAKIIRATKAKVREQRFADGNVRIL